MFWLCFDNTGAGGMRCPGVRVPQELRADRSRVRRGGDDHRNGQRQDRGNYNLGLNTYLTRLSRENTLCVCLQQHTQRNAFENAQRWSTTTEDKGGLSRVVLVSFCTRCFVRFASISCYLVLCLVDVNIFCCVYHKERRKRKKGANFFLALLSTVQRHQWPVQLLEVGIGPFSTYGLFRGCFPSCTAAICPPSVERWTGVCRA